VSIADLNLLFPSCWFPNAIVLPSELKIYKSQIENIFILHSIRLGATQGKAKAELLNLIIYSAVGPLLAVMQAEKPCKY